MSYIGNLPTTAAFPFDQFSGTGSQTAFTLSQAPASTTSIVVAVSGVVQNPNTYSVAGVTLTFTEAPPSGTNNIGVLFLGLPSIVGVPNAGSVGISALSASGTKDATTFLRGDNTFSGVANLTTASGTAPSYSARAWVNFNGTGTVAIRASGNVSSITDRAVGRYTVNMITPISDINYAWAGSSSMQGSTVQTLADDDGAVTRTTSAFGVLTVGNAYYDDNFVQIIVFR